MSSSRDIVFATPELLEAILSHLSQRSLLSAQLISRHFHNTIDTSPLLQHLLFFKSKPANSTSQWTLNPLLREHFIPFFVTPGNRWAMPSYEQISLLDGLCSPEKKEAFLREDASWRRMLLIQPVPTSLPIVKYCHSQGGDTAFEARISFEDSQAGGVTMGAVYDIAESFLGSNIVSQFGLSILTLGDHTPPEMTLFLILTAQCCVDATERQDGLRSRGARVLERDLEFKPRQGYDGRRFRYGLELEWNSDLTVEKGGVGHVEFEGWRRERAPISSLLSDNESGTDFGQGERSTGAHVPWIKRAAYPHKISLAFKKLFGSSPGGSA